MYAKTQRQRQIQTTFGLVFYAEAIRKIGTTEGENTTYCNGFMIFLSILFCRPSRPLSAYGCVVELIDTTDFDSVQL